MFYISYFYQVRHFSSDILPLSTAIWDPKWYHQNNAQTFTYRDKNNVLNGMRIEALNPEKIYDSASDCRDNCPKSPDTCEFLMKYEEYLNTLDFDMLVAKMQATADENNCKAVVLLVHEAPTKPCSERCKLVKWFNSNGYSLPEWKKPE